MLDPIVDFFTRVFQWIGRGIGFVIGILLWPFMWFGRWYTERGWILKTVLGAIIAGIIIAYGYFFYVTQFWTNFDPDYPGQVLADAPPQSASLLAGERIQTAQVTGTQGGETTATEPAAPAPAAPAQPACKPSEIADMSAFLVDFNVNQNAWISSMLVSKLGLFSIPWRNTPWFDNKAAFQLGINQVMRRTTTELVDTLGRARGTSRIDQNLQNARTALAWDEDAWYVGVRGPTRPTPSVYRDAIESLNAFNASLQQCQATFDARADNLMQFLDRIAGDMGSTSDILRGQIEA
jgi:hypothetical protein